jgi:hypothetical protein
MDNFQNQGENHASFGFLSRWVYHPNAIKNTIKFFNWLIVGLFILAIVWSYISQGAAIYIVGPMILLTFPVYFFTILFLAVIRKNSQVLKSILFIIIAYVFLKYVPDALVPFMSRWF